MARWRAGGGQGTSAESADEPAGESWNSLFLVLAAVLIICTALFMYALSLGRTPETFSEVWLEQTPEGANPGEEFGFSFAVSNHEGKEAVYDYRITAEGKTAASGSVRVAGLGEEIIPASISLWERGRQKVEVEVSMPEKEEPYRVWFWVLVGESAGESAENAS